MSLRSKFIAIIGGTFLAVSLVTVLSTIAVIGFLIGLVIIFAAVRSDLRQVEEDMRDEDSGGGL